MFTKLDEEVIALLCCPLCKGVVGNGRGVFVCSDCGLQFRSRNVSVGRYEEEVYDFRIHRSSHCVAGVIRGWESCQKKYVKYHRRKAERDSYQDYLAEIESVKEIYTTEWRVRGKVLDVGGHQGRLRHFLSEKEVSLYVSVDPYFNVFENIQFRPNLLKAYPCLAKPCNFLSCHAESLPFSKDTFDFVHMRSCIDHFLDPFRALKEAHRVLEPNGTLMVGLAIKGGRQSNDAPQDSLRDRIKRSLRAKGIKGLKRTLLERLLHHVNLTRHEDHMFHLTYEELNDLIKQSGYKITKEHWQKSPFEHCIYLAASPRRIEKIC